MVSSKSSDDEALLKAILQESVSEVLVVDAETLRILQANPAAMKNLQHRLKALQKLTLPDCVVPEDVRTLKRLLALLRNGKRRRTPLCAHFRRHDGSCYPVQARLFYSSDHDRQVFIYIGCDVSQAEASQHALEHSESDLRAIVAHIPGIAFQVLQKPGEPPTLRYVSGKSAQLLGIKAAKLRARPEEFFRLILEEDRPGYLAELAKAPGGHMTFNWEGRLWIKAWKDVKWVAIRVSRRQADANLIWDGIMLNVTNSKVTEAKLRDSRAHLSALAAHVESVKEQERVHLAREVHDDLGGNLTAIKIGLSCLAHHFPPDQRELTERVDYLASVVDQSFDAVERIASNLRPLALDLGIVPALKWQLQHFARNTDIACRLNAPREPISLDPNAAVTVFRIVQEALTNVARHAGASRVTLKLSHDDDSLVVTIADNGRGLQPPPAPPSRHRFGILGMSERAAMLGGQLDVQPGKRKGTRVSLRVPLSACAPATQK